MTQKKQKQLLEWSLKWTLSTFHLSLKPQNNKRRKIGMQYFAFLGNSEPKIKKKLVEVS